VSWSQGKHSNPYISLQPFLAVDVYRGDAMVEEPTADALQSYNDALNKEAVRIAGRTWKLDKIEGMILKSFELTDLNGKGKPEIVASLDVVEREGTMKTRSMLLVGRPTTAGGFQVLFSLPGTGESWRLLDSTDVDGDGNREVVLVGVGSFGECVEFLILERKGSRYARAFRGSAFGPGYTWN
jgi:hypothetical protein